VGAARACREPTPILQGEVAAPQQDARGERERRLDLAEGCGAPLGLAESLPLFCRGGVAAPLQDVCDDARGRESERRLDPVESWWAPLPPAQTGGGSALFCRGGAGRKRERGVERYGEGRRVI
jgi:hypothetical protein